MQSKYREYVQRGFLRWKHQESPTGSDNDGKQWGRLSRNETNPSHKRHVCKYKESMNGAQILKKVSNVVLFGTKHTLCMNLVHMDCGESPVETFVEIYFCAFNLLLRPWCGVVTMWT